MGPICAVIWRGETTLAAVQAVERTCLELAQGFPGGIGLMGIIEATARIPSAAARQATADVTESMVAGGLRAIASVCPGGGFRGAAVRGVLTGLYALANRRYPTQVYRTPAEGSLWLATQLSPPFDPSETAQIIERARASYSASWRGV